MADDKATDLMCFCANEFQGFFTHIGDAIKQFKATGRLPESVFLASSGAGKADAKPKIKRKPTAFNMFVKAKMEELKASGLKLDDDKNNNEIFKLAVAEWTHLSEAERKQYKAHLEEEDDADGADLDQLPSMSMAVPPQAPGNANAEAPGSSNKRRADAQATKGSSTAAAVSAEQNGDKPPKKKKRKDKKAA